MEILKSITYVTASILSVKNRKLILRTKCLIKLRIDNQCKMVDVYTIFVLVKDSIT
jgi:hypothetical protein